MEGKCPECKTPFTRTMPEKDYESATGIIDFCIKCNVKIDYHVVDYDEEFREDLVDQPCKICNYPISDIHHIVPKKFGGTDEKENLVNLCPNHHRSFHVLLSMERKFRSLRNKNLNNFKLNQQAGIFLKIMQNDKQMFDYFLSVKSMIEGALMTDAELFKMVEKSIEKEKKKKN